MGVNLERCFGCEYFYKDLYRCPFTACIKRYVKIYKNGRVVEVNLDDLNKKKKEIPKLQKGGIVSKETAKRLGLNKSHDQELPKHIIKKIMKEGKGYSSTLESSDVADGIFSLPSLTSPEFNVPMFKEWKESPDVKSLEGYRKELAIQILTDEV